MPISQAIKSQDSIPMKNILILVSLISISFSVGCATTRTTNTARTGVEQLLISGAVDQTLSKAEWPVVNGRKVFIEEKYLDSVDKGYIVAKSRQRLLSQGALLVDKKEDSEVTVELSSGGVGTDSTASFVGMPGLTVPGLPIELPEVRLFERSSQFGTAKIGVVSYDTASGKLIHDGGTPLARSDDSRWSVLGVGPVQRGSVRRELRSQTGATDLPTRVADAIDLKSPIRR